MKAFALLILQLCAKSDYNKDFISSLKEQPLDKMTNQIDSNNASKLFFIT